MKILVFENKEEASFYVAESLKEVIQRKLNSTEITVLGLATGSTPLETYKILNRFYDNGDISFKNVVTFNLDEYYPISPNSVNSYRHFMNTKLFFKTDIPLENTYIPSGDIEPNEIKEHCVKYDDLIAEHGGIEIQLLGIGLNGHIGFNEPKSQKNSLTRLVALSNTTRIAASDAFGGIDQVPEKAISMGIKSILRANKIILMAWGTHKAEIIKKLVDFEVTDEIPATFLKEHSDVTVILDKEAASALPQNAYTFVEQTINQ